MIHRLLFYLLLVEAPLFLGSNRRIFWGINACLTALCLAAFTASEWQNRRISRFDWRLPLVACGVIGLAMVWMAIQATTWSPEFLHHPIWKTIEPDLRGPGAISIDPPLTWIALAWTATLAIVVVAVRIGTSQDNLRVRADIDGPDDPGSRAVRHRRGSAEPGDRGPPAQDGLPGLGHRDLRQSQYRRQFFRSGHDRGPEPGDSFCRRGPARSAARHAAGGGNTVHRSRHDRLPRRPGVGNDRRHRRPGVSHVRAMAKP